MSAPVDLVDVVTFLRERRECNCSERERNLTREAGDRMHASGCAWWPDAEYTLEQVADMLTERFEDQR